MRHALIGLCIFTAACSGQTFSPTSPSGVGGVASAQTQANGGANVEVTFTKWVHRLSDDDRSDGRRRAWHVRRRSSQARSVRQWHHRSARSPVWRSPAPIRRTRSSRISKGKTNTPTQKAVLNGTVIAGWLAGAQVQVTFDVIPPTAGTSCVPEAPVNRTCFQGTIRVMPGSAN